MSPRLSARTQVKYVPIRSTIWDATVQAPVEQSEWQERADSAERHEQARESHTAAAARHDAAALRWSEVGDSARANFEHRNARIERDAAELEGDRAQFYRETLSWPE